MIWRWSRLLSIAATLLMAVAAIAPTPAFAADIAFPPLTGRVVDEPGILSPQAAETLTAQLAAHEQRTGEQVVVAVVKSLQGQAIEDYGYQLGRAWGIGQKGKNTGAILLVAPTERKVRIEVGYGLEGDLTDAVSSTIIDQVILTHFRQGDISGGIVSGAGQILRALGDDIPVNAPPPRHRQPRGGEEGHGSIGSIILTFLIFGLFFWLARRGGGGMFLPFLIASSFGGRGGGSSWGGGDRGGGFSGGGGSFGGGGASGSW